MGLAATLGVCGLLLLTVQEERVHVEIRDEAAIAARLRAAAASPGLAARSVCDELVPRPRARGVALREVLQRGPAAPLAATVLLEQFLTRLESTGPWCRGVQDRRGRPELLAVPGTRLRVFVPDETPLALVEVFRRLDRDGLLAAPVVFFPGTEVAAMVRPGLHPRQSTSWWLQWQLECNDLRALRLLRAWWIVPRVLAEKWEASEWPTDEVTLWRALRDAEWQLFEESLRAWTEDTLAERSCRALAWMDAVGLPVVPSNDRDTLGALVESLSRMDVSSPFVDEREHPFCAWRWLGRANDHGVGAGDAAVATQARRFGHAGGLALDRHLVRAEVTTASPTRDTPDPDEQRAVAALQAWLERSGSEVDRALLPSLVQAVVRGKPSDFWAVVQAGGPQAALWRDAASLLLTEDAVVPWVRQFLQEWEPGADQEEGAQRALACLLEVLAASADRLRFAVGRARGAVREHEALGEEQRELLLELLWRLGTAVDTPSQFLDLSESGWLPLRSR